MLLKCGFQMQVRRFIAARVEVEQSIEANALHAGDISTRRRVGLQPSAGTDTYEGEGTMLRLLCTCLEIDIRQSIELIHYDVDVVAAYSGAESRDALAFILSGDGMELTIARLTFLTVEMGGNEVYTSRVSNEDDFVGKLLGFEMEMEYGAVAVDDKLRFRKECTHNGLFLLVINSFAL